MSGIIIESIKAVKFLTILTNTSKDKCSSVFPIGIVYYHLIFELRMHFKLCDMCNQFSLDHDDGFSMVLFTSAPLLSMVFCMSTICINGFSMVFHRSTIGINGFPMVFNVEPWVSMVFSMVTIYLVFWLCMTEIW